MNRKLLNSIMRLGVPIIFFLYDCGWPKKELASNYSEICEQMSGDCLWDGINNLGED